MHAGTFVLLLLAVAGGGCSAVDVARRRVAAVRPSVDLGGVRIVDWTGPEVVRAETAGLEAQEALSFPFVRAVFRAHWSTLVRLGCVPADADDEFVDRFVGDEPSWAAAFVVPPKDAILVRPEWRNDARLLAHEFGHIASWRAGHWAAGRDRITLDADAPLDPGRVDLDALIACWALEEGTAEATARAAFDPDEEADREARAVRAERVAAEPAMYPPLVIVGPSFATIGDRVFDVPAGEVRVVDARLPDRLRDLAYGGGLRYVDACRSADGSLDDDIRVLWDGFAATTRAVLALTPAIDRPLAEWLRRGAPGIEPPPTRTTSAGSLLLLHGLASARPVGEFEDLLALAVRLGDDAVLTFGDDAMLWVTRWDDVETAARFAILAETVYGARITIDRRAVALVWGDVPAVAVSTALERAAQDPGTAENER